LLTPCCDRECRAAGFGALARLIDLDKTHLAFAEQAQQENKKCDHDSAQVMRDHELPSNANPLILHSGTRKVKEDDHATALWRSSFRDKV